MTPATEALVAQAEKYVAAAKPNFAADGFISGLIGIVREQAREIERLKGAAKPQQSVNDSIDSPQEPLK